MNRPISPASDVVAEWLLFRRARWRRAFADAGFEVSVLRGGPLFYTGQLFAPGLPFVARAALARIWARVRLFALRGAEPVRSPSMDDVAWEAILNEVRYERHADFH